MIMREFALYIFHLAFFPGFIFLVASGMFFHWIDRKLLARFEGRVGPPWYQPLADIIKLFAKEDILPIGTNQLFALLLPLTSFASTLSAGFHILGTLTGTVSSFNGDFIMLIFLISLPSLLFFLGGWTTSGVYSILGGNRSLLQYFSYEVLFIMAISGTAIASGSWSLAGIFNAQSGSMPYITLQIAGFILSIAGLIGKLKRSPYDIPKAKSEMVMGPLTEYSGGKLALWKLADFLQTLSGIALIVYCYFGGLWLPHTAIGYVIFILLMLTIQFILSIISAVFTRLRIDQLIDLNWRILIPLSLIHNLLIMIL